MTLSAFSILALLLLGAVNIEANFQVSTNDILLTVNSSQQLFLFSTEHNNTQNEISFYLQHMNVVRVEPDHIFIKKDEYNWTVTVFAINPGSSIINANVTGVEPKDFSKLFVRVKVERSDTLNIISTIVGWIYFSTWSISFYPQIYINYKRKSVDGLNFDFLSLNLVGFILYSLFNCGLYWIKELEQEYLVRHPKGLNPVQPNDIFFSLHAVAVTFVTILQCFIYESGNQRISTTARIIHGLFGSFIILTLILAIIQTIHWLDFLYYCSYIKLTITLIKYVPQAYHNYKRKSTIGWSIENIFLDFTGGILSMLQMILNAYNYNDWISIFGDPTKFGLGLFSVAFDVFFLVQNYILYRHANSKMVDLKDRI